MAGPTRRSRRRRGEEGGSPTIYPAQAEATISYARAQENTEMVIEHQVAGVLARAPTSLSLKREVAVSKTAEAPYELSCRKTLEVRRKAMEQKKASIEKKAKALEDRRIKAAARSSRAAAKKRVRKRKAERQEGGISLPRKRARIPLGKKETKAVHLRLALLNPIFPMIELILNQTESAAQNAGISDRSRRALAREQRRIWVAENDNRVAGLCPAPMDMEPLALVEPVMEVVAPTLMEIEPAVSAQEERDGQVSENLNGLARVFPTSSFVEPAPSVQVASHDFTPPSRIRSSRGPVQDSAGLPAAASTVVVVQRPVSKNVKRRREEAEELRYNGLDGVPFMELKEAILDCKMLYEGHRDYADPFFVDHFNHWKRLRFQEEKNQKQRVAYFDKAFARICENNFDDPFDVMESFRDSVFLNGVRLQFMQSSICIAMDCLNILLAMQDTLNLDIIRRIGIVSLWFASQLNETSPKHLQVFLLLYYSHGELGIPDDPNNRKEIWALHKDRLLQEFVDPYLLPLMKDLH
ncbi:hypothetical protein HDU67_001818 [Dinochytrium kinnereticum]|nr:hypothetical protein HDU67_001818 [Dinochytrium kinnereticum]